LSDRSGPELVTLEIAFEIDGDSSEPLFSPSGLSVDSNGRLFVLDTYARRVFVFDGNGGYETDFGGSGEGPGLLSNPLFNFSIDRNDHVYLIDLPGSVEVFDDSGAFEHGFSVSVMSLFDIAAYDSTSIFLNCPFSLERSNEEVILKVDWNGDVLAEFGRIDADVQDLEPRMRTFYTSCVMDVDSAGNVYYSSILDYKLFKYDPDGIFLYSVEADTPYGPRFSGSTLVAPVVWDLCVDEGRVYVMWGQGAGESGACVDVYDCDTGDFLGFFHTQVPAMDRPLFIAVRNGEMFYTDDGNACRIVAFDMEWLEE
jgi:hypothetical protein